jgi:soluble lytic murein transglycosylase-like protein
VRKIPYLIAANGLPFEFLARVIWQESRFRPDAVGLVQHD